MAYNKIENISSKKRKQRLVAEKAIKLEGEAFIETCFPKGFSWSLRNLLRFLKMLRKAVFQITPYAHTCVAFKIDFEFCVRFKKSQEFAFTKT